MIFFTGINLITLKKTYSMNAPLTKELSKGQCPKIPTSRYKTY